MAEALGVAGSAIGIISFGIQTAQGILWYYKAWKDGDDDVLNLCASLSNLTETLETLRDTLKGPTYLGEKVKDNVDKSITTFSSAMNQLEDELAKVKDTEPPKPGVRSTMRRHVRKALYPFREATLRKIQGAVSDARSSLNLALDILQLDNISYIRRQMDTVVGWQEDKKNQNMLDWLSPLNPWLKQQDVSKQKQDGTGQWLLDDPIFLEWERDSRESLWCQGHPGAGKTVLTSAVIEYLEKDLSIPDVGLAFIYCNYKERQSQSVKYFTSMIARQLVEQRSVFPDEIRPLYEQNLKKRTQLGSTECLGLLRSLSEGCSEVYIVIDALDECIDMDGESVWSSLLTDLRASILNLRLFCTSRYISDIGGRLAGAAQIKIRASDADIETYILAQVSSKHRLLEFCQKNATLQDDIVKAVRLKAEGSKKQNLRAIRKALHELPRELDDIYHEAMKRIKQQSPDDLKLAIRVLSWIVYALRPLQFAEIQHAMAVNDLEPDDRFISSDCLTPQDIIVNVCAGLIIIDEKSNIIRLVHYTTQEYFERSGADHISNANWIIATTCLRYLLLDSFSDRNDYIRYSLDSLLKENPLLEYAACNWGNHVGEENNQHVHDLAVQFLLEDSKVSYASQVWFSRIVQTRNDYFRPRHEVLQGIHYVAYFGLKGIMIKLLSKDLNIDADLSSKAGRTPLSWAAGSGKAEVVKLLLETGVYPDSRDERDMTPLHWAVVEGHEGIVKLLLEKDIDVDCKDDYDATPLHLAAEEGHERIVKLLLEKHVDVDFKNGHGTTPLHLAAVNGHEGTMKLLLEKDADVDCKDGHGLTPLYLATKEGHEGVVKLLLETAVDPDSGDERGMTPLYVAAEKGYEGIVKLLLEKHVDVDCKDDYDTQPLYLAVKAGHEGIVNLLLEKHVGVDFKNFKNMHGITPLHLAAENRREGIVRLLLEKHVDVDCKGMFGATPLHFAAREGQEGIVKLLLEKDADVDCKGSFSSTPLHLAAENWCEGTVRLLLEKDADVDCKDDTGRTPLHWAAIVGHEGIVKLLLEKDADVDFKDDFDTTPLYLAARRGHEGIVKLLREKGADVDCKDDTSITPLHWAAEEGREGIVMLLLEKDADVDCKDNTSKTPLYLAAEEGHEGIVKLLREKSAVMDFKDNVSLEMLHLAAMRDLEE